MNRTHLHLILTLALLLLVIAPVFAAAPQQVETQGACGVRTGDAAQMVSLLMPVESAAGAKLPDFTLHYIGQCCVNNDASSCPAVNGYSTVSCAFPLCGSGQLSCVYQ